MIKRKFLQPENSPHIKIIAPPILKTKVLHICCIFLTSVLEISMKSYVRNFIGHEVLKIRNVLSYAPCVLSTNHINTISAFSSDVHSFHVHRLSCTFSNGYPVPTFLAHFSKLFPIKSHTS